MSSLRYLIPDLAARPDAALRGLLASRTDLLHPPVADFAALAARASGRASMAKALEGLNLPQLQVLEALALSTDEDRGLAASAPELAALIEDADEATVAGIVAELYVRALIYPVPPAPDDMDDDGGPRRFVPVTTVKDVVGAHPAGLGRTYRELADAQPGVRERLAAIMASTPASPGVAAEPGSSAPDPAELMRRRVSACAGPDELLAGAPAQTAELLSRFRHGPLGAIGHARRAIDSTIGTHSTDSVDAAENVSPVDWLLGHGLLVPLDNDHVELPAEVGRVLRHGHLITGFTDTPPALDMGSVRTAVSANAAASAVAATLRNMSALVGFIEAAPVATLRSGGVGVREIRRLRATTQLDVAQLCFYLELAAIAGLIMLDPDTSHWRTAGTGWERRDRAEQWLWLASAWRDAPRLPALVGTGAPAINALAGEASRLDAPQLRRLTLQTMAELGKHDAASLPALAATSVQQRFAWHHPRLARRLPKVLPGFLAEAELLGLTGSGALTAAGAAVVREDWDAALELVRETLPAVVEHVLLQADLTAVAPGYLSPRLARELELMADPEGQGPATIYRFTEGSVRRALDAGRTAESVLAFLAEHAATDIPQALAYLVTDTAARHGRISVGSAAAFISSDDTALLADLLANPAFDRFGFQALAPTVLTSAAEPREVAAALRAAGLPPALLGGGGIAEGTRRRPATPSTVLAPYERIPAGDDVDLQLALLHSKPAWTPGAGEAAPQLILETLRQAIRLKRSVELSAVDSAGDIEQLRLIPVSVSGGRVRAFDQARDSERVFSIHRIMDVELAPLPDGKGST